MRRSLIILLAACVDSEPSDPPINGLSHVASYELPAKLPPPIDVLFVLDDTAAMAPYQTQLAALPALAEQVFSQIHFGMPDMRIAVATSAGLRGDYLSDSVDFDFVRAKNYQGTLAEALAPQMNVGTSGSTRTLLQAARDAAQTQFVRPTAYLGIVFVTASDDLSSGEVAAFASDVKAYKSDPTNIAVSAIRGQAMRLDAFLQWFPNRYHAIAIDDADWTPAISLVGQLIRSTLELPCAPEPADVDPNTPGEQYDCAMSAFYNNTEHVIRQCVDGGSEPCWYFERDLQNCYYEDYGVLFKVRGYDTAGYYHPAIRGQCVAY